MVDRLQQPRIVDQPEPCFIRMQMVSHGPFIAARIFLRFGMLAAEINGSPCDPMRVWHGGDLIDEARYNLMMEDPHPAPWLPVRVSDAGLSDRVREAEEADYWFTQPIR